MEKYLGLESAVVTKTALLISLFALGMIMAKLAPVSIQASFVGLWFVCTSILVLTNDTLKDALLIGGLFTITGLFIGKLL